MKDGIRKVEFDLNNPIERAQLEAIQALQEGKITLREYQERIEGVMHNYFLPDLNAFKESGDWEGFIAFTLSHYEVMGDAFKDFDKVPDSMKYRFAIDAYMHHGDSVPEVRKAVRNALKYGKPSLPEEIAGKEIITVYRAGEEPIKKAKYRISWTTDIKVAEFFLREYIHAHANFLYMGKIRTADIIGYTNERNESEVLQYGKVFNIEDITEG